MIKNKQELISYLEADKKALGRKTKKPRINDVIWKYEISLRKCEFYNNCKSGYLNRILFKYFAVKKSILGIITGFSIPINVVDRGLCISHIGPIVISEFARVGTNCRIHICVNIGSDARISGAAPVIGNNVYIGPGAKIYGKIAIADNIAIGANSVVNKSFVNKGVSIAGVPARVINNKGVCDIFKE